MVIWNGFPKKMHVYCMYFDVSALKYVYTCKYVQYTSHIHTIYDTNTYFIRQYTSVYICMYMYVYTRVCLSTVAVSMFSCYTALKIAERHNRLCF